MTQGMDDILESFVFESLENLDEIEPVLILLGGASSRPSGVDRDIVNQIFRVFHTIKGTAGFLNLPAIEGLTHEAESILDQIRSGELEYQDVHTGIFCEVIDLLRSMVAIAADSAEGDAFESAVAALVERLRATAPPPEGETPDANAAPSACEEDSSSCDTDPGPPANQAEESEPRPRLSVRERCCFVEEAYRLLGRFESLLVAWQEGTAVVDDLVQVIDVFKESCSVAGAKDLERLSDALEGILGTIRSEGLPPRPGASGSHDEPPDATHPHPASGGRKADARVDQLLAATDRLRRAVSDFAARESGEDTAPPVEAKPQRGLATSGDLPTREAASQGDNIVVSPGDARRATDETSEAGQSAAKASISPRVLLVDDDRSICDTITFGLAACDWSVVSVRSAAEALDYMAAAPDIDVLLTDLCMPEVSGVELIEHVRERWPSTPVVAITIDDRKDTFKRLINQGVDRYVEKPFTIEQVRTACLEAIARRDREQPPGSRKPRQRVAGRGRRKPPGRSLIRVSTEKLDAMVNLVSEMVIAESMLTQHPDIAESTAADLNGRVYNVRRVLRELRDVVMTVRMVPLSATFQKMVRLTHDVAAKLQKNVELKIVGEETEVDKTINEQIGDPLVHILRNAIDHGLEMPGDRQTQGKPAKGTIVLQAMQEGSEVVIRISDDGRGIDRQAVLKRAMERKLIEGDGADLSDEEVFRLIFEPGFSTAKVVSGLSGRGVGMDVVKRNIEQLGGRITIRSVPGTGTVFSLRIPMTLSVIDGVLVEAGGDSYTVPLLTVCEMTRIEDRRLTQTPGGTTLLKVRDSLMPLIEIATLCGREPPGGACDRGVAVVVESDGARVALRCDSVVDRVEAVVKALPSHASGARYVSNCTVLGNGRVSLILDVRKIVRGVHQFEESA